MAISTIEKRIKKTLRTLRFNFFISSLSVGCGGDFRVLNALSRFPQNTNTERKFSITVQIKSLLCCEVLRALRTSARL